MAEPIIYIVKRKREKMKRISIIVAIILLIINMNIAVEAASDAKVKINGANVTYNNKSGYPFIDKNSRIQVPLGITLEKLGATVNWDAKNKVATVIRGDVIVKANIGTNYILKNGTKIMCDTTSLMKGSIAYVPIRMVLEAFGADVGWDTSTRTVNASIKDLSNKELTLQALLQIKGMRKPSKFNDTVAYTGYTYLDGTPINDEQIIPFTAEFWAAYAEGSYYITIKSLNLEQGFTDETMKVTNQALKVFYPKDFNKALSVVKDMAAVKESSSEMTRVFVEKTFDGKKSSFSRIGGLLTITIREKAMLPIPTFPK